VVSNTSFFFTDVDNDDIDDDGDVPMTKRGVNEEAAGMEAGRLAHEEKVEKKGQESERLAAMAAAQEAERLAQEKRLAAQQESERLAAMAAAQEAGRLAQEERLAAQQEFEKLVAMAAAQEAERLAQEERLAAQQESWRLAAMAAAQEAERLVQEERLAAQQESGRLAAMAAAQEAEKEKAAKEEWSRAKRKRQQEDAQSLTQRSKRSQVQLQKLAACLQLQANNRAVDPAVKIKRDPEYLESVYLTAADTSKIQEAWDAQWSTLVWNTVKEKNGKISKFLLCYFRH